ncbi:MAG TPA: response regulator, partial [Steroidobacteraceae bacterium]
MSAARILVVDDEAEIRGLLKEILADEGYEVDVAADAEQARQIRAQHDPDLILLDIWMPDTDGITLLREWSQINGTSCPVVMMSGHGTVETAVEATRLGAFDFVEKPLSLAKLLRTVERALEAGRTKRHTARTLVPPFIAPVGRSPVMQALREQVQQVAPHDTPLLIVGEPGSGREAFARYIHSISPRSKGPFVQLVATGLSDEGAAAVMQGT